MFSGKYPEKTVEMMHKICCESEAAMFHRVVFDELRLLTPKPTETLLTTAIAAVDAAFSQNAAAIMCLTTTGRYLSIEFILRLLEMFMVYRAIPIIAFPRVRTIYVYMCVCVICASMCCVRS